MLEILLIFILIFSLLLNILLIYLISTRTRDKHELTEEELEMLRRRLRRIKMLEEGK